MIVVLLFAPSVSADTTAPLYAKMKQSFTTAKPGHATGWSFDGALKPYPAGEQVPPQRSVDFVYPEGTRLRLGAVPSCLASDEQIMSEGAALRRALRRPAFDEHHPLPARVLKAPRSRRAVGVGAEAYNGTRD